MENHFQMDIFHGTHHCPSNNELRMASPHHMENLYDSHNFIPEGEHSILVQGWLKYLLSIKKRYYHLLSIGWCVFFLPAIDSIDSIDLSAIKHGKLWQVPKLAMEVCWGDGATIWLFNIAMERSTHL